MGILRPRGRQSAVVYLPPKGHAVVLGTAGTGKTVMAMLRARYLAARSTPNSGKVLLVTYNNALVGYISRQQGDDFADVQVETYHLFARGYLKSLGLMPAGRGGIAEGSTQRHLISEAIKAVASEYPPASFFNHDLDFFQDEIDWISGMGLSSFNDYVQVSPIGREVVLDAAQRAAVWRIREHYRQRRMALRKPYDWHDIASAVRAGIATDSRPRKYKHIVIDEGQDLTPEMIRSLVEVVDPAGSVTFFGDYAQQIYGRGLSWRACNLDIEIEERFADNYRNTAAIANLAIALSRMPFFGRAEEDLVAPIAPTAQGTPPTVVACRGRRGELSVVRDRARALAQVNTVAILARTWRDAEEAAQGLNARKLKDKDNVWDDTPGLYYGSYHSAKGLEFDVVIMPFCSASVVPSQEKITAFGWKDAYAREARLLYVGITRARSELILTFDSENDVLTPLLPTGDSLFVTVTQ